MKMIIVVFLTILLVFEVTQCKDTDVFVKEVAQNFHDDINKLITDQITLELQASYIYNGYASYFQRADVNLPGMHKFFSKASLEERTHANMLMDYVNKRGGHVRLDAINMDTACTTVSTVVKEVHKGRTDKFCICEFVSNNHLGACFSSRADWQEALHAMEDALATERYVNQKLLDLHQEADKKKDAHLSHFLEHELLSEQIEAIYELGGYVTRLRQFKDNYKLGEYLFDQNLK